MLKSIRVVLALLSLLAVTLLFVDFTGTAASMWPWLAKIQFIPALLACNIAALALILLATLLLGRVYCSVVCPLGIFQDVVNWLRGHVGSRRLRKNRFRFATPRTGIRLAVLTVFAVLLVLGLTQLLATSIAGLIEPYSAYGRIASQVFAPVYDWVNNLLAAWSESQPANYTFYRVAAAVSIPVLVVAIVTLVVVVAFAWTGGRDYCNTVCPVGTVLGYLSKTALVKVRIDENACINCGKCGRNCKAKCIDTRHHAIDYTRCVACMDCIGVCSEGAIKYTWRKPASKKEAGGDAPQSPGRRGFVTGVGAIIGAASVQALAKTTDGGLTALKTRQPHKRANRIVPAGAVSLSHLAKHCTACQLCIQSCPNKVLKPTISADGFMQPHLDYTDGYCDPNCTICSEICPAGAFHPLSIGEKSSIKVGTAIVDLESCISAQGNNCGNCARHCPAGAIMMVHTVEGDRQSPRMPVINENACIGCGECEYFCPVGTVDDMEADSSAIRVEGIEVHRNI